MNQKRYGKKGQPVIFDYQPTEDMTLLPFLLEVLAPKSRSDVKSMLAHYHVQVNGTTVTQFDMPLTPSDRISINFTRPFAVVRDNRVHILYEDDYLIAVEKPSGMLSVGREGGEERTVWSLLTDYMKQKDPRSTAYVCHRLDQYTSGILVFAKDGNAQRILRYQWDTFVRERGYYAVVEGVPPSEHDELRHYLLEDSAYRVHVVHGEKIPPEAKLAVTRYALMQTNGHHSLLNVHLFTGRKNQIRAQLSEIGCPVAGDRKYGATTSPASRLMLHNYRLSLVHPVTHELLTFELPAPKSFYSTTKPS